MNQVAQEMKDILMHYGTKYHSGRYPYGSGGDPYQHDGDFLTRVDRLKKDGWTETAENVKKEFGMSLKEYRNEKLWANYTRRELDVSRAKSLKEQGLNQSEIGREMGISESTVRSLLNAKSEAKMMEAKNTADFIKSQVDERGMIEVGLGVERELNISRERMDAALYALESEGYTIQRRRVEQFNNPGNMTTITAICPPGTPKDALYKNLDQLQSLNKYISRDGGETYEKKFTYPESMDSKRLMIRYNEEGGLEKDGLVELRRGVNDLSLGNSHYAQVRILVDNSHYIKGMAVYSDKMPDGVDVVFNTNKKLGTAKMDVLKKIENDPDNPFGSLIKDADQGGQYWYDPATGKRVSSKTPNAKLGLINKRADEGDWSDWKDALPSQFLSKQPKALVKKQLDLAIADKQQEYDLYSSLTNPTVKKYFLNKFADECDASAVDLKAAALPGQKYNVMIPINSLKDNEVYAPGYTNGTELALIRYPHAGTFEIPILTVNNKNKTAREVLDPQSRDAIGVSKKNADRLSGADFDGDTVMCVPTNNGKVKIKSTNALKDLADFDAKFEYGPGTYKEGTVKLIKTTKAMGTQMGIISNLITDMTLFGAPEEDLAKAVKHSMVIVDAKKHKLDYKRSEIDNDIALLHKKWQGHFGEDGKWHNKGASTIISRAKGEVDVLKRQGNPIVDPLTGKKSYKVADDVYQPDRKYDKKSGKIILKTADGKKITYDIKDSKAHDLYNPVKKVNPDTGEVSFTNKKGDIIYKIRPQTQKSTRMAETDDAYSLVSDRRNPKELIYADFANKMKSLANEARKQSMSTGRIELDPNAKKIYQNEVASLDKKLNDALLNAPRERMAQIKTAVAVQNKQNTNPDIEFKDLRKTGQQALTRYREEVGSIRRSDRSIKITDREWEAIQAGAISESKLIKILNNTDVDSLRERATPRSSTGLTVGQISRIKSMRNSNLTIGQIADALNLSTSTISNYLKGDD